MITQVLQLCEDTRQIAVPLVDAFGTFLHRRMVQRRCASFFLKAVELLANQVFPMDFCALRWAAETAMCTDTTSTAWQPTISTPTGAKLRTTRTNLNRSFALSCKLGRAVQPASKYNTNALNNQVLLGWQSGDAGLFKVLHSNHACMHDTKCSCCSAC